MPGTQKLNSRVHDFFQKFKRDRGPVKVDPQRDAEAEAGETGENLPAQSGGRDVSIAQIKQGYGEVLDTMQSVRRHLDDQAQRSDRMISLLEGLPEVIRSLPEQNKAQTEMLRAIYQNMERQTETTGQLSTAISSLSTVGENQQKTMGELQDHLRAEDVARRELREGIGTLDKTLTEVRESSDSSRSALESISEQAKQRDTAIGEMFQRSQKTTSAMMAVSWALAIVALAVSAFVAVRVTQISGDDAGNAGATVAAGVASDPATSGAVDAASGEAASGGVASGGAASGGAASGGVASGGAPVAEAPASVEDAAGIEDPSGTEGVAGGEASETATAGPAPIAPAESAASADAGDASGEGLGDPATAGATDSASPATPEGDAAAEAGEGEAMVDASADADADADPSASADPAADAAGATPSQDQLTGEDALAELNAILSGESQEEAPDEPAADEEARDADAQSTSEPPALGG